MGIDAQPLADVDHVLGIHVAVDEGEGFRDRLLRLPRATEQEEPHRRHPRLAHDGRGALQLFEGEVLAQVFEHRRRGRVGRGIDLGETRRRHQVDQLARHLRGIHAHRPQPDLQAPLHDLPADALGVPRRIVEDGVDELERDVAEALARLLDLVDHALGGTAAEGAPLDLRIGAVDAAAGAAALGLDRVGSALAVRRVVDPAVDLGEREQVEQDRPYRPLGRRAAGRDDPGDRERVAALFERRQQRGERGLPFADHAVVGVALLEPLLRKDREAAPAEDQRRAR